VVHQERVRLASGFRLRRNGYGMLDNYTFGISSSLLIQALDVFIVSFLIYRALLIVRGTRAASMLVGLASIAVVYAIAKPLGLVTLAWLIDNFLNSIILVIVVIFQDEIRRTLTNVGIKPFLLAQQQRPESGPNTLDEIAVTVSKLAKAQLGSLIVIKRNVGLEQFMAEGVVLNAEFSRKLLYSIFVKESPLHDGAVIIEGRSIKAAGCVLPLSFNPDIDPNLGTRHRAALGLAESSDAMVIVVSEESGSITLIIEGRMYRNLDAASLQELLENNASAGGQRRQSGRFMGAAVK